MISTMSRNARSATVRAKTTTVAGLMGRQNFFAMLSVMPATHWIFTYSFEELAEVSLTFQTLAADQGIEL